MYISFTTVLNYSIVEARMSYSADLCAIVSGHNSYYPNNILNL